MSPRTGAFVLLIQATISLLLLPASAKGQYIKSLDHFELESNIIVIQGNSSSHLRVIEVYSKEIGRSKIVIYGADEFGPVEYYYDEPTKGLIQMDMISHPYREDRFRCRRADQLSYLKDLVGPGLASEVGTKFYKSPELTNMVPDIFLGYARFLLIAEHFANRLKQIKKKDRMRNYQVSQYGAEISTIPGVQFDIFFPYHDEAIDGKEKLFQETPIRLMMHFGDSDSTLLVDLLYLGPIRRDTFGQHTSPFLDLSESLRFPLGIGCGALLETTRDYQYIGAQKVASFHMDLFSDFHLADGQESQFLGHGFIAIDQFSKTSRKDCFDTNDEREPVYKILIHDWAGQRTYMVRQPLVDVTTDQDNPLMSFKKQQADCYASKPIQETPAPDQEPIIPMNNLVEMGSAHVRGSRTKVFELVTNRLPAAFFPRFLYFNATNQVQMFKYQGPYIVNYYIAVRNDTSQPGGKPLGPLMRVTVHSEQRTLYRIEIKNFVWYLKQAPNGDKHEELFSLQDRCFTYAETPASSGSQEERSARALIELEHEWFDLVRTKAENDTLRGLYQPTIRNRALIRVLRQIEPSFAPTRIHSLQSMVRHSDELKLTKVIVSMELAFSLPRCYSIQWLGYTSISPNMVRVPGRFDIESCSHEAAKLGRTIAFAYSDSRCIIDPDTIVTDPDTSSGSEGANPASAGQTMPRIDSSGLKINNSKVSKQGSFVMWHVFRLDFIDDQDDTRQLSDWNIIFGHLDHRAHMVHLPLLETYVAGEKPENASIVKPFALTPTSFEISNRKWFAKREDRLQRTEYLHNVQEALHGVSLTLRNATLVTDFGSQYQMDMRNCLAICQARSACRSYSVCTRAAAVECMTSSAQLDTRELANQLGEVRKKSGATVGKVFNLRLDKDQASSVEMKLDRLCNTYNRRTLDLFRSLGPRRSSNPMKSIRFVEDAEECARNCFELNLQLANQKLSSNTSNSVGENGARKQPLATGCSGFNYLSAKTRTGLDRLIEAEFDRLGARKDLCSLKVRPSLSNDSSASKVEIVWDSFMFHYELFFKRQPGIQLIGNVVLSRMKTDANSRLANAQSMSNQQSLNYNRSPDICARTCVTESSETVCRSFDFVIVKSTKSASRFRTYCIINSKTMSQLMKTQPELVTSSDEVNNGQGAEVWHYEPQFGFLLNEQLEELIEPVETATDLHECDSGSPVAIVAVVFLALISAILLSVILIRKISGLLATRRGADGFRPSIVNIITETMGEEWQLDVTRNAGQSK